MKNGMFANFSIGIATMGLGSWIFNAFTSFNDYMDSSCLWLISESDQAPSPVSITP